MYDCVTPPPLHHLLQALPTTGALDLGGASTQISFVSKSFDGSESPHNSVIFRLYGSDYSLYTHSFLCYGKDQALKMVLASQIQVGGSLSLSLSLPFSETSGLTRWQALHFQSGPATLDDPCLNRGYVDTKNYSHIYNSPCVSSFKPASFPATFTHRGTGNFQQCQERVKSIFNSSSCNYSQCSFNGVYQPLLQGRFGVREPLCGLHVDDAPQWLFSAFSDGIEVLKCWITHSYDV